MHVHPLVTVLTMPEVLAGAATVVVAVCGAAVRAIHALSRKLDSVGASAQVARTEATQAAEHARTAAEQTANHHGANLRDDLDAKFALMGDRFTEVGDQFVMVMQRMDAMEMARIQDRDHDRAESAARHDRAERQIDGLRDDVRNLGVRVDRVDARVDACPTHVLSSHSSTAGP